MAHPQNLVFRILVIILLLIMAGGLVCLFLENQRLIRNNNRELARNEVLKKVVVFFITSTANDFKLQPVIYSMNHSGDTPIYALQLLLAGPPPELQKSGFIRVFPEGAGVISCTVKNGLATVNLNQRTMELNAGSSLEAAAVVSMVNTLTKFPDVFRVKFLIEGKEVESLAGHVDLTGEFHYSNEYVDPFPIE